MLAPSAWTASIMQLFTSRPSTVTLQAPQLPVSQPMWRAGQVEVVADEVDRAAGAPRRRARSVVPFTSTVMRRLVSIAVIATSRLLDRARDDDLGDLLPVLGRRVDVARRVERRAEPRDAPAFGRRRSSLLSTSVARCGTASTQPSATRGAPSSDTAAETMQVPSRPIVTDAKPSRAARRDRARFVRISPGPAAVM